MLALPHHHPDYFHHHGRHTIDVHDHHGDLDHIPSDIYPDVTPVAVDQPVTVADLLDALNAANRADRSGNYRNEFDILHDLRNAATDDVRRSYYGVKSALEDHYRLQHRLRALSLDERAEFDRRTT